MIKDNQDFKWLVTNFDCNNQKIKKYNVLRYREEDIKKLKKKYPIKEEFEKELRTKCMSQYWSRAEYELIIFIDENSRVYLKPWCGCRDDNYKIDVTDATDFDWKDFAEKHNIIINCGAKHCLGCLQCYKGHRETIFINEQLK